MTLTQIKPAGLSKPLDLADGELLRFGNDNNLTIYHNSGNNNNYISENGTGSLLIQASDLYLTNTAGEYYVICATDGRVQLNFNNNEKLRTTNSGIDVTGEIQTTGHIRLPDNMGLIAGTGSDLFIYHDGSNSFIDSALAGGQLLIRTKESGGTTNNAAKFMPTGAVELYYDGSKKFETTANGIHLNGTTNTVNGDFYPINDTVGQLGLSNRKWASINSVLLNINGGDAEFRGTTPGTTDMTWDQSENALRFDDNVKAHFGGGSDLQISHDGSHSKVLNTTGNLFIGSNASVDIGDGGYSEYSARFTKDGAVSLYYDNVKKFETTSDGVEISGGIKDADFLRIGTTSTTGISGGADDLIIGSIGDGTDRGLTFATTSSASIRWADAGDNAMGRIQYSNATDVMMFMTSNTNRLRLDSDGLKFNSDSAAANALDDYEEGTFTPLMGGSNYGSYNITGTGKYTKIGRIVHFELQFANKDLNDNATGDMRIRGWPFAWSTTSARPVVPVLMMHNVIMPDDGNTNPSTYALYGGNDGISMYGIHSHDGTDWDGWPISCFELSTLYLDISGSYMT